MRISFADLNLASEPGRKTLKRRVWAKVHHMCRGGESSFQPTLQDLRCRTSAWVQAAPQIRLAVERARGVASTGASPIAASAIVISPEAPQE
jgi:UrcA family protein